VTGTGPVHCDHCGLPVPTGRIEPGADRQFCCSGCRLAWDVIHDHGLDRYYELRSGLETDEQPARTTGAGYEEFDDPTFAELYVRRSADGLASVELYLEGVHCAACVWLVERVPVVIDGVAECRLDIGRSLAVVRWDPDAVPLSSIARFLDRIGYPPHPFRGVDVRDLERREDRSLLIRIAVAGAIAGNVMLLAFALYGGHFHGISDEFRTLFRWLSLALATPSVLWCAAPFHRGAWGSLRTRRLHMDVPISIGVLVAFTWGIVTTVRGSGEIYFDSVTVLIFLLLAGRFVQRRQQRSAARATEMMFSLTPTRARRLEDGTVREVAVSALKVGDLVEVRAGDSIPADGVVRSGTAELDLSLLTGESRPVTVSPGEPVHAGTVNLSSPLHVEVRTTGEDTRVGRLMRMVEEAAHRRAPVVLLADRISAWFVVAVLVLATGTAAVWAWLDPAHAVDHAVALLIVSCPCALGLATPLAVSAAIGRAARAEILVKGGDALEVLARPGRMILDKTGTLTEGRMTLERWIGDDAVQPLVAAIESRSSHPTARALVESLGAAPGLEVSDVRQVPGRGVVGRCDGHDIVVGSAVFVADHAEVSGELTAAAHAAASDGLSPVLVAVDGHTVAVAGMGDPLRPETPATIAALARDGWRLEVLSGDHPDVVRAVTARAGVDPAAAHGAVPPEDKADRVAAAALDGTVVMVGDGVNDAAALAAATVGVAVHGGAEAALAAADVFLARPGIDGLADLVEGARRTLAVIRRNLVFSLTYNVVAVSLAITGHMHPLLAAVLMPLSSITVVVSSYRARTFERRDG